MCAHHQQVWLRGVRHADDFICGFSLANQTLRLYRYPDIPAHHLFKGVALAFQEACNAFFFHRENRKARLVAGGDIAGHTGSLGHSLVGGRKGIVLL